MDESPQIGVSPFLSKGLVNCSIRLHKLSGPPVTPEVSLLSEASRCSQAAYHLSEYVLALNEPVDNLKSICRQQLRLQA